MHGSPQPSSIWTTASPLSRRRFLHRLSAIGLAATGVHAGCATRRSSVGADPFTLGVASGDPDPEGVVLWTRLAPRPLDGGGMPPENVEVEWRVATDDALGNVVQRGTTTATPDLGHTVHIEVQGLEPDRWYWYQFSALGEESPVGRTRTTPQISAAVDRLDFVFASCQHYEQGYYTALRHLADEDLDLVVHLGDYIYEGPGTRGRVRRHTGQEIESLADYRNRYALYKSDPDLQAAHAAFPWLVTWDDHEVDNDYAGEISERSDPVDAFLARRANAYQAYYEHMPLRRFTLPRGPNMRLYRRVSYGSLAEFFVLDTRQYRTDQPCDGSGPLCAGALSPDATLMGRANRNAGWWTAWVRRRHGGTSSRSKS